MTNRLRARGSHGCVKVNDHSSRRELYWRIEKVYGATGFVGLALVILLELSKEIANRSSLADCSFAACIGDQINFNTPCSIAH
jgi:hypothetical protein